jgi:flagellar biosynthesis protein FlhA
VSLGRAICDRVSAGEGTIVGITIDPHVETKLSQILANTATDLGASTTQYLRKFVDQSQAAIAAAQRGGREPAILVKAPLRKFTRDLLLSAAPRTPVLSYNEAQSARSIESAGVVKVGEAAVGDESA